jgi:pimeloyl-ACP methyl ester carboxylesterase
MLPKLLSPTTRSRAPEVVDQVRAMIEATPVPGIVGALGALRDRPDSTDDLKTLDGLPVLVVVGEADEVTPPARAQAMAEAIPGAELLIIPGAAHLPPLERPTATTRALLGFLRAIP